MAPVPAELAGAEAGLGASEFDWSCYWVEFRSESQVVAQTEMVYLDHVAWIKYHTTERLKSRSQAEEEWWQAIADVAKFPGRDFKGPGECPTTLMCTRAECAGGRVRIQFYTGSRVLVNNIESEVHVSQLGNKQVKKPKADAVEMNEKKLSVDHSRFSSSRYTAVGGKLVASITNDFSKAQEASGSSEDENAATRTPTKTK